MHADLKYVESIEKEIDKLESDKAEFSNMYDMILQECVSNEVMCSYLLSLSDLDALAELQCLYLHKVKECDCHAQKISKQTESVSKEVYTELLQRFAKLEKHSISLEIALQKCKEHVKNDTVWNEQASNVFRKERMYRIDNRTTQTRTPQSPQNFRNTNPRVSNSTRVNHKTNVSRPQHRSNQIKVKVVPNNSQVKLKKTQVEDHPRIPSISNKIKTVTVCIDSLNSRTSNVNVVCVTCGKCLVNSNHFACVTKMLNDINARTKKPNVVPISTRNPKGHANKSIATPHKQKVASQSTTQKPKSYYRMLYEKTSKAWKWWIEQQCPSRYKWVPKTKMQWIGGDGVAMMDVVVGWGGQMVWSDVDAGKDGKGGAGWSYREARLIGEALILNRSLDPLYGDYIELNDRNEPLELRRNRVDKLEPTIEEGEVVDEPMMDIVKTRCDNEIIDGLGYEHVNANFFPLLSINLMSKNFYNSIMKDKVECKGKNVVGAFMNIPIFVGNFSVVTGFAVVENMDAYRDDVMGDVIVGRPFCKEACIKARRFDGMITLYKVDDSMTYQMARSHPRFKHLTNAQCNKMRPLLKVSAHDELKGILHPYQKLKGFYKEVLNLEPKYIKDEKVEEWLTRGHVSIYEME
nr:homeodomain-like protein [Tanacetum cinerariifolium]